MDSVPCFYRRLMHRIAASFIAAAAAAFVVSAASARTSAQPAEGAGRQRILMDADWRFHRGELPDPGDREIAGWSWKLDPRGEAAASEYTGDKLDSDLTLNPLSEPQNDVFHMTSGFAWYRIAVSDPGGPDLRLFFRGVNDNATVYVNGVRLFHHEGWNVPFDVPVSGVWRADRPNVIAVLVENKDQKGWLGGVQLQSTVPFQETGQAAAMFADADWQSVHLPHDYQLDGPVNRLNNTNHGFLAYDIAWYRKTFSVPQADAGKRIYLDFDGVYRDSEVYLNGHLLGRHKSGYTSFEYDATDTIHFGARNVLAVRVDPREFEGWWYEGGGIYRHVWLVKTAPLHVAHWGTYVVSTIPGADKANPPTADVTVTTTLQNSDAQNADCQIVSEIVAPGGKTIGSATVSNQIDGGKTRDVAQKFAVNAPELWSPERPSLYRLITKVEKDGQTIDTVTTPFGIRTIAFDAAKGFFLNGKHVEIQGMCNHQNFAVVGTALPDNILPWRVQKLKEAGCNAYRMSHDPQASEQLDACDALGMMVMDENRHFGDTYTAKTVTGTPYSDLSDLRDMVLRDRNHPSIILWSMCNEEPLAKTGEAGKIMAAMRDLTRSIDSTRPVTCAMLPPWGTGISTVEDIQGFNHGQPLIPEFHEKFPDKVSYGSEMPGAVVDRGIYESDIPKGYVDSYSLKRTAEAVWRPTGERPYMAGTFVWTGFDYQGEPGVTQWPSLSGHFGILDLCGFPKDDFYYFQSWWQDKPVVHVMPHWNWAGKEGTPIVVWVYSNCDKVELFLNGTSLGVKDMTRLSHLEWQVPYAPGKLEAKGYTAGKTLASDTVETAGAAAKLDIAREKLPFRPNGEDLALVTVAVRDSDGRFVATADNELHFTVQGPATLVGTNNGNPNDHTANGSAVRKAFSGRCLLVLRASDAPGKVVVTVTSPGLPDATVALDVQN